MGTTWLDQQSLDQAVVLTSHPSDSPAPSSGGAWAGTTEVSRPHWAEQMVWVGCFPLLHIKEGPWVPLGWTNSHWIKQWC
jgi:hypothetical protein